jgi:hypothetical protein
MFSFRSKGTNFQRITQTKSQKTDEYFQNNHIFVTKVAKGRSTSVYFFDGNSLLERHMPIVRIEKMKKIDFFRIFS